MINNKRLFLLFLYIIFIIALIEGTTRLFFKITNQHINFYKNFVFERMGNISMADNILGWKLIPNTSSNAFTSEFQVTYKTNSLGLREKEIENVAKFRILFLGDSMTFGEGVPSESRFSDLIEKEIENVYTINAGIPTYGIHQMCLWLKYYGLNLKPDLVICSIVNSDLMRAVYKKLETAPHVVIKQKQANEFYKSKVLRFTKAWDNLLLKRSYFYAWARVKIKILLLSSTLRKRDKRVWEKIKGDDMRHKITISEQGEMVKQEAYKIFLDFKKIIEPTQIKFLVVNISRQPILWLENFFAEQNIDYLDLSTHLRNVPHITFEIDPHYNVAGHRLIANLLKEYILGQYKQHIGDYRTKSGL